MHRARGFSLLEVIVVVAIVAILSAMAVSAYGRYARRARRADAQQALLAIANSQERWYATHQRYADELAQLGYSKAATTPNGYYELTLHVDGDQAQSFVATAHPLLAQAADECGSLSIDNRGNTLPARDSSAEPANGRCW
ncbi:type IV pilin protein [Dyella acidiphila]|uniref:Type IV pilin protein n=1 Tax=Dyella acidiphila TaxID=2775866 RepID=A0ABR9GET1_9GAMM|nr:type IV pilin protein [Dyella acidiphila]MBE1162530.1 type IV pilin protein [Dyella acidiphila]